MRISELHDQALNELLDLSYPIEREVADSLINFKPIFRADIGSVSDTFSKGMVAIGDICFDHINEKELKAFAKECTSILNTEFKLLYKQLITAKKRLKDCPDINHWLTVEERMMFIREQQLSVIDYKRQNIICGLEEVRNYFIELVSLFKDYQAASDIISVHSFNIGITRATVSRICSGQGKSGTISMATSILNSHFENLIDDSDEHDGLNKDRLAKTYKKLNNLQKERQREWLKNYI